MSIQPEPQAPAADAHRVPAPAASVDASGFPNRPIFLIGMMGSGKSTVGRRLAQALHREFIDADKEIEHRCGVPIPTIFDLEGEAGFRRREAALIDELTRREGLVLATGGGAVLLEENRRALHERGLVIYLRATLPELWHRLRHDKARPLLRTANPRQRIADLLALRDPLYEQTAHLSVTTGRQPVERVVADIIERFAPAPASPPATAGDRHLD
jgi:shikimate kinase